MQPSGIDFIICPSAIDTFYLHPCPYGCVLLLLEFFCCGRLRAIHIVYGRGHATIWKNGPDYAATLPTMLYTDNLDL